MIPRLSKAEVRVLERKIEQLDVHTVAKLNFTEREFAGLQHRSLYKLKELFERRMGALLVRLSQLMKEHPDCGGYDLLN